MRFKINRSPALRGAGAITLDHTAATITMWHIDTLPWRLVTALLICANLATSHTVITYPGDRGDNLNTNGTVEETNGLGRGRPSGENGTDQQPLFPYGMQWMFPCGGMPQSTNRTTWGVGGGAIALQPGWFTGHATGLMYMNIGLGTLPSAIDIPLVPVFQMVGPNNFPYPGTLCLPNVTIPADLGVKVGDNATIQVILAAQHGASLYNVRICSSKFDPDFC